MPWGCTEGKGSGPALLFALWVPVCVFHMYESGDIGGRFEVGVELLPSLLLDHWRELASTTVALLWMNPNNNNTMSTTRPPQYTYCETSILKLGSPYKRADTSGRYGYDPAVVP